MEAILIWCQCRTREYDNVKIENFTNSWADGLAFCALIHHFFPQSFDYSKLSASNRKANYELAFLTADDMEGMVADKRIDPKMIFSYVQEVYRMCNEPQCRLPTPSSTIVKIIIELNLKPVFSLI